jgi:hypothetical protein
VNAVSCENHTEHADTECRGLRLLGSLPLASYDSQGGGYHVGGGRVIETEFGSFEGSQAVPASPSGKGQACIRDLFYFDF